ncbi:serine/threonine protein kinase [Xylanimonas oleitrophica]|uniref:non-specific serine/threonine protein kinase n=1 Tax=Xylanimonas oleitrophica TaxID=2607479 RepID=A0A2W5WZ64_9MICO|nr:serine/threonine protein kinase [Xylanimonas oleitrophica]PZR53175.1 serine/threonine protein kinase [Xylanimonas oleitrophica]
MRPSVGLALGDRYRLTRRLAVGGMGEVWVADDTFLGREVAVKVLREEYTGQEDFLQRLRTEARNSAALSHPNIAQMYDYGEQDGTGYLVMELVLGEPLADLLEREPVLPPKKLLPILAATARGLHHAHEAGVVHRDVKPGNVLLERSRSSTAPVVVKITDFGVSLAANQAPMTATGMVMGTAQYLSPEQAVGQPATPLSDVYALGVMAYEATAGRRPFTGQTPVDIAVAHVNNPVPALPTTVHPELSALIMRLLEKDPARRPVSAGALAEELTALARDIAADPLGARSRTARRLGAKAAAAPSGTAGRRAAGVVGGALGAVGAAGLSKAKDAGRHADPTRTPGASPTVGAGAAEPAAVGGSRPGAGGRGPAGGAGRAPVTPPADGALSFGETARAASPAAGDDARPAERSYRPRRELHGDADARHGTRTEAVGPTPSRADSRIEGSRSEGRGDGRREPEAEAEPWAASRSARGDHRSDHRSGRGEGDETRHDVRRPASPRATAQHRSDAHRNPEPQRRADVRRQARETGEREVVVPRRSSTTTGLRLGPLGKLSWPLVALLGLLVVLLVATLVRTAADGSSQRSAVGFATTHVSAAVAAPYGPADSGMMLSNESRATVRATPTPKDV